VKSFCLAWQFVKKNKLMVNGNSCPIDWHWSLPSRRWYINQKQPRCTVRKGLAHQKNQGDQHKFTELLLLSFAINLQLRPAWSFWLDFICIYICKICPYYTCRQEFIIYIVVYIMNSWCRLRTYIGMMSQFLCVLNCMHCISLIKALRILIFEDFVLC